MPSSRGLTNPGIEPRSTALQVDSLPLSHLESLSKAFEFPAQCFRKLLQLHYSAAAAELCQHLSLFLEESVIFLNCILETSSFSRATLGRRELGK